MSCIGYLDALPIQQPVDQDQWVRIAGQVVSRTGSTSERSVAYLFVPASMAGVLELAWEPGLVISHPAT